MFTGTVKASGAPKVRRTPFGVKSEFFASFDDGTKAMVDSRHLRLFRRGTTVRVDADVSNGWLNVKKKTQVDVEAWEGAVVVPWSDVRHTPDGLYLDAVKDNERYVALVPCGSRYPSFNALPCDGEVTFNGVWSPERRSYRLQGEDHEEWFWTLVRGTALYNEDVHVADLALGGSWSDLHAVVSTGAFFSVSDVIERYARHTVVASPEDIFRWFIRAGTEPWYLDYLFAKVKRDPYRVFLNVPTGEWAFRCEDGGTVVITPSESQRTRKYDVSEVFLNTAVPSGSVLNGMDFDAWSGSVDTIWSA